MLPSACATAAAADTSQLKTLMTGPRSNSLSPTSRRPTAKMLRQGLGWGGLREWRVLSAWRVCLCSGLIRSGERGGGVRIDGIELAKASGAGGVKAGVWSGYPEEVSVASAGGSLFSLGLSLDWIRTDARSALPLTFFLTVLNSPFISLNFSCTCWHGPRVEPVDDGASSTNTNIPRRMQRWEGGA